MRLALSITLLALLCACTELPEKLDRDAFEHLTDAKGSSTGADEGDETDPGEGSDTGPDVPDVAEDVPDDLPVDEDAPDAEVETPCENCCAGSLSASNWAKAAGWQYELATPNEAGDSLEITANGSATLPAQPWNGGFKTLAFDVPDDAGVLGLRLVQTDDNNAGRVELQFNAATGSGTLAVVTSEEGDWASPHTFKLETEMLTRPFTLALGVQAGEASLTLKDAADVTDVRTFSYEGDLLLDAIELNALLADVHVENLVFETDCPDGFDPADCGECSGSVNGCSEKGCSALGGCALVAAADGTDCADDCFVYGECSAGACVSPVSCEPLDGWAGARILTIFEPESTEATGEAGAAKSLAAGNAKSSWARANEPLDIALVNGLLDADLVGYWPLDGNGDNVVSGGVGLNTTFEGAAHADDAVFGGAYVAPGPGLHATVEAPGSGSLTLMIWYKPAITGPIPIFGLRDKFSEPDDFVIEQTLDGYVVVGVASLDGDFGPAELETWQHLAVTWDQASGAGRAYLDGVLKATFSDPPETAETILRVGGGLDSGALAALDEAIYSRRALSAAEIAAYVQSHQPFGSALVEDVALQPDYDDVEVHGLDGQIEHEIVGRRPYSDTPAGPDIMAYWRFDNASLDASLGMNIVSEFAMGGAAPTAVAGAFGDPDGALPKPTKGAVLWKDRKEKFETEFSIELWLVTEVTSECTALADNVVAQTTHLGGGGAPTAQAGWLLRICNGKVRFLQANGDIATAAFAQFDGETDIADGQWHHVLLVADGPSYRLYIDGLRDAYVVKEEGVPTTFDDDQLAMSLFHLPGPDTTPFDMAIDDLILHRTGRPASYAWSRVYPRLPTARFLVSSDGDQNELPTVSVNMGNPTATHTPPPCGSMYGACSKTLAWWDFDQLRAGDTFVDQGAGGLHAKLTAGQPAFAAAAGGAGIVMDGTVEIQADSTALQLSTWTLEAVVLPTAAAGAVETILWRGDATAANFVLRKRDDGAAQHGFITATDAEKGLLQGPSLALNKWAHLVGKHSGAGTGVGLNYKLPPPKSLVGITVPEVVGPLFFGTNAVSEEPFQGVLDFVRISAEELTDAELIHFPRLGYSAQ